MFEPVLMQMTVTHSPPSDFYLPLLIMRDGKFIGNTGERKSGRALVIVGTDRADHVCEYKSVTKQGERLFHKALYIDITGIPGGERVVKSPDVPAWLSEAA